MDFRDSQAEAEFREGLREWLASNNPGGSLSSTDDGYWEHAADWHRSLYEAGYFGLSFPERFGGRGLLAGYEAMLDDELADADAPPKPSLAYIVHGMMRVASEETCQRFLPSMIDGTERWCQGFSEPDAGSDLAGLRTTAERDGDEFVVNGHKIWTSYSDRADWCLLLARTDPEVPKHKGISAFALPMKQAGVTQRPLKMINGISNEFGEVILDDARVPASNMIGEPGMGWTLAMAVLNHERSPADLGYTAKYRRAVLAMERLAARDDETTRATWLQIATAHVQTEVLRVHVKRRLSERLTNHEPGPEGAADKLMMSATEQVVGNAARLTGGSLATAGGDATWLSSYLYSRAATVMGGSAQIQKNILAAQVLGLPSA